MSKHDPRGDSRHYVREQFDEVQRGSEKAPSVELMERQQRVEPAGTSGEKRVPTPKDRRDAIRYDQPTEEQAHLDPEEDAVPQTPSTPIQAGPGSAE